MHFDMTSPGLIPVGTRGVANEQFRVGKGRIGTMTSPVFLARSDRALKIASGVKKRGNTPVALS